jgi:RNase P protein component
MLDNGIKKKKDKKLKKQRSFENIYNSKKQTNGIPSERAEKELNELITRVLKKAGGKK